MVVGSSPRRGPVVGVRNVWVSEIGHHVMESVKGREQGSPGTLQRKVAPASAVTDP